LLVAVERVHDVVREREQRLAERRRLDAAVADGGHRAAHRIGELAQHARDGGLREAELLGGAGDGAEAHARLEGQELGKEAVTEETPVTHAGHVQDPRGSLIESAKVSLAHGAAPVAGHTGAHPARPY
jgi:hypothetical protein